MTSSRVGKQTLAASLIAFGLGLGGATIASADPGQPEPPVPGPPVAPALGPAIAPPAAPAVAPPPVDATKPAVAACRQFNSAWRVSSSYYNNFAQAIAGTGVQVHYHEPTVQDTNVEGRAALRKSAAEALSASGTPGLQPEVAAPMRSWSLQAAKLLVFMGVHTNKDTLNNAATELNSRADDAQMACAKAGVRA